METDMAWLPQIDEALCTGCGDCIIVCPTDVLALADEIAILAKPDACNYCGACETVCPVGAIVLPYQIILEPGV
jgi:NAD-dependent dihydropyrimidine dehydrogenase PreA subunit